MYRKSFLFLTVLFFGLTMFRGAQAEEDQTCYPSGRSLFVIHRADNHQSGYDAFHKFCKSCHNHGEDSKGRFLTMESKSREGWEKVFTKRKVDCAKDGAWDSLTELQMWNLRDYLFTQAWGLEDPHDVWKAYECPKNWNEK